MCLALMFFLIPNTGAITGLQENDLALSDVSFHQNGKELHILDDAVKDTIDSREELNISMDIINPKKVNFTIYLDKTAPGRENLWEEFHNESFQMDSTSGVYSLLVILNDTGISYIRVRVSLNVSDDEPVFDPDTTNNQYIIKIESISADDDDEKNFAWYHALIALIPLGIVFVGILVFKISSRYVAPTALITTIILALIWFRADLAMGEALRKMGSTILYSALWGGLDYVYAIFGAFFFLKMLEKVGAMDQLKNDFKSISDDKQHQVLLIGFCFAMILATVAPAGSNFVIAAIMLVSLGFNRIGVGVLCLFGNSISSVFGLLGVSIIALKEVTGLALLPLSGWIGIYMIVLCIFAPLIMNIVYTEQGPLADFRDPDLREDIILLMGMGAVYGALQALVAYYAGPELPTIVAGGATLLFVILYEKYIVGRKEKKKEGAEHDPSKKSYGLLARPYFYAMGLMIVLLLVTRLVMPLRDFLTADYLTWEVAFKSISADKVMKFSFFYSPGTVLLISTASIPLFMRLMGKYFPSSEMEATFMEDLGTEEITSLEEAEKQVEKTRIIEKEEGKRTISEKNVPKKRSANKKISTDLTREMKKAAEKIKSTKKEEDEEEDGEEDKKGGSGSDGKTSGQGKKKMKKKRKKSITKGVDKEEKKADRGSEDADEYGDGDDDDDDGNGKETSKSRRRNDKRRRREPERSGGKRKRKIVNDGGDYEVVFDDDDDDDENCEMYFDDDDDDMFDVDFDEEIDDDDDDGDDGEEGSGDGSEEVKTIRIDLFAFAMRPGKMLRNALTRTVKDVLPILLTIVAFVAMANIMRYFDLTYSIAVNVVDLVGGAYIYFVPLIGMSGSALTGSTTTSNVLFGGLHIEAASRLGLPAVKVAAAQVLGSSAGEMISPMNAVVIATAIGLKNKESILIKRLLPTFAFWLVLCTIIAVLFVSL